MLTETSRKHLGLDFLRGNNFFHPKQLKCIVRGMMDLWNSPISPIYRKKEEEVAAQLTQASWVASGGSNPASKIFWKGQIRNFENCYLHPPFDKFTPLFSYFYGKVTEALRKHIGLDFLIFSLPSHPH